MENSTPMITHWYFTFILSIVVFPWPFLTLQIKRKWSTQLPQPERQFKLWEMVPTLRRGICILHSPASHRGPNSIQKAIPKASMGKRQRTEWWHEIPMVSSGASVFLPSISNRYYQKYQVLPEREKSVYKKNQKTKKTKAHLSQIHLRIWSLLTNYRTAYWDAQKRQNQNCLIPIISRTRMPERDYKKTPDFWTTLFLNPTNRNVLYHIWTFVSQKWNKCWVLENWTWLFQTMKTEILGPEQ